MLLLIGGVYTGNDVEIAILVHMTLNIFSLYSYANTYIRNFMQKNEKIKDALIKSVINLEGDLVS